MIDRGKMENRGRGKAGNRKTKERGGKNQAEIGGEVDRNADNMTGFENQVFPS